MFEALAMVHSQESKGPQKVTIVSRNGNNEVIAEINGMKYTAIFNPFIGLYYVDDIYGEIKD